MTFRKGNVKESGGLTTGMSVSLTALNKSRSEETEEFSPEISSDLVWSAVRQSACPGG